MHKLPVDLLRIRIFCALVYGEILEIIYFSLTSVYVAKIRTPDAGTA
jgi:hypothetical protein